MLYSLLQKIFGNSSSSAHSYPLTVSKQNDKQNASNDLLHGKIVCNEVSELPEFESILTAGDGIYALSESLHSKFAVLKTGNKSALILTDEESHNRQDFASLLSRVKKDYLYIQVRLAKSSVMLNLYSQSRNSVARRDRDSSETALSVSLFKDISSKAALANASDVHFMIRDMEHSAGVAEIHFRVEGVLRVHDKIPSLNALEVVGVAYTKLAEGDSRSDTAFNARAMQSCSIPIGLNGKNYKLRYQSLPVNGGLDVIIRFLQTATVDTSESEHLQSKSLEELGYSPTQCKQLNYAARKTVGVTIISGITGSGKSTTLKTLMTTAPNRHRRKSYSIEDPVEYSMSGVSQINSSSKEFTKAMRVVLRSDPDIVMVGEVRDGETCSLLKTMVQSGHQVMTSVHAASSNDIVQRMTSNELGLPRETLGSKNFLSALVYQRLVPKLCEKCKVNLITARNDEEHHLTLNILQSKFGLDPSTMFTTRPGGCDHCTFLGSKGVTVVAEVVIPDNYLLRLFREGRDVDAEEHWRNSRTTAFTHPDSTGKTAFEHGLYKAHIGIVDPYVIEASFEPFETYTVYPLQSHSIEKIRAVA